MKKQTKIMVVDDDQRYLELLEFVLKSAGYNVIAVQDSTQAKEIAVAKIPDLIVTDVVMPNLDGVALGVDLRTDKATAAIPILYVTAMGTMDLYDGGPGGGNSYLSKPFTPVQLIAAIQKIVQERTPEGARS